MLCQKFTDDPVLSESGRICLTIQLGSYQRDGMWNLIFIKALISYFNDNINFIVIVFMGDLLLLPLTSEFILWIVEIVKSKCRRTEFVVNDTTYIFNFR